MVKVIKGLIICIFLWCNYFHLVWKSLSVGALTMHRSGEENPEAIGAGGRMYITWWTRGSVFPFSVLR